MRKVACGVCGAMNNDINSYCIKCKSKMLTEIKNNTSNSNFDFSIIPEVAVIFEDFLKKDNIDVLKFQANYEILKNESMEIYKATVKLHSQLDISQHATPSIEILGPIMDRPLGYPMWFIAAYPDIVIWFANLDNENMGNIFGNVLGNEDFDTNSFLNHSCLRKIINFYTSSGNILECVEKLRQKPSI